MLLNFVLRLIHIAAVGAYLASSPSLAMDRTCDPDFFQRAIQGPNNLTDEDEYEILEKLGLSAVKYHKKGEIHFATVIDTHNTLLPKAKDVKTFRKDEYNRLFIQDKEFKYLFNIVYDLLSQGYALELNNRGKKTYSSAADFELEFNPPKQQHDLFNQAGLCLIKIATNEYARFPKATGRGTKRKHIASKTRTVRVKKIKKAKTEEQEIKLLERQITTAQNKLNGKFYQAALTKYTKVISDVGSSLELKKYVGKMRLADIYWNAAVAANKSKKTGRKKVYEYFEKAYKLYTQEGKKADSIDCFNQLLGKMTDHAKQDFDKRQYESSFDLYERSLKTAGKYSKVIDLSNTKKECVENMYACLGYITNEKYFDKFSKTLLENKDHGLSEVKINELWTGAFEAKSKLPKNIK